ncbi:helix-turn-helix domain-containing protein, partial [Rhizobium ruizarguesonis]
RSPSDRQCPLLSQMSQVARKLGIGRYTLYRKLKDYGIDPDNPQKDED